MLSFLKDRLFLREMLTIAVPISLQQLINASLNLIDVLMVGQLGEASIAAIGLSNQVFFVFILMIFGLTAAWQSSPPNTGVNRRSPPSAKCWV